MSDNVAFPGEIAKCETVGQLADVLAHFDRTLGLASLCDYATFNFARPARICFIRVNSAGQPDGAGDSFKLVVR